MYFQVDDKTLLTKAEHYLKKSIKKFELGEYDSAILNAREAIFHDKLLGQAYFILSISLFESGDYCDAIKQTDINLEIFQNDIAMEYLYIRFRINLAMLDVAYERLNKILSICQHYLINAELVYYYLVSCEINKAYNEIVLYTSKNPSDSLYKKVVSVNILLYVSTLFRLLPNGDRVITEKDVYNKVIKLCKKAYELDPSADAKNFLSDAEEFGKKELDPRFKKDMTLKIASFAVFALLTSSINIYGGIALSLFGIISFYFCYRPKWAIIKYQVTGLSPNSLLVLNEVYQFEPIFEQSDIFNNFFTHNKK